MEINKEVEIPSVFELSTHNVLINLPKPSALNSNSVTVLERTRSYSFPNIY